MHILEVKELVRDYSIISEDKKERTQRVPRTVFGKIAVKGEAVRGQTMYGEFFSRG